jgi:hypothetical protein
MKRDLKIITALIFMIIFPFTFAAGQEKKSEQRIKIVIADDKGEDVVLDTLITGKPLNDSIILKNGQTIYIANEESDKGQGSTVSKKYIITTSDENGPDSGKEINKEITVISTDSGTKDQDSERTKYVIARDGMVITIEGSDYAKVRELTKEIEKTLDKK